MLWYINRYTIGWMVTGDYCGGGPVRWQCRFDWVCLRLFCSGKIHSIFMCVSQKVAVQSSNGHRRWFVRGRFCVSLFEVLLVLKTWWHRHGSRGWDYFTFLAPSHLLWDLKLWQNQWKLKRYHNAFVKALKTNGYNHLLWSRVQSSIIAC